MGKRAFDIIGSALGLLLLLPVLLACALAVRLDSRGPVFFRQTRVGLHGQPFTILKFRTMVDCPLDNGLLITATGDSRITAAGRWLRRTKLDELPQLINVLRGDMSLVGPRPEVPRYVALYPAAARGLVLSVRPGITDEASILFRDESELLARATDPDAYYMSELLPRKLEIHARYARDHSLAGDWRILVQTLRTLVS